MPKLVLGIESTAHTASVGLVKDRYIAGFKSDSYSPARGGINPRDAAEHHRTALPALLKGLLRDQRIDIGEIDRIAFSIGPGLGPALKTGVELARYLAIRYSKELVPVNHGVGHLEIARRFSGFKNPVFLYVSGGNTQLITIGEHRYSVLGETLDIGVGNFLDKLARDLGIPFPGAPVLEKLARKGKKILDCPYTVRGMDVSYSGLYTHLKNRINRERLEDIAYNAQEYSFTALAEIVERGMAHFGLKEFTVTGGVARNRRLREILAGMGKMRGYRYYFPEDEYLSDNGAMIALAGYMSDLRASEDVRLEQADRVDSRESRWIGMRKLRPKSMVGGESVIETSRFEGMECVVKKRRGGEYRNKELNSNINNSRIRREVRLLGALGSVGIRTPSIVYVNLNDSSMVLTKIHGKPLSQLLTSSDFRATLKEIGKQVAVFHDKGISHGDLNAGNIIVGRDIFFIDPSMGELDAELEDLGVDIHLMKESLTALGMEGSFKLFLTGYRDSARYREVLDKVDEIESRRRYT